MKINLRSIVIIVEIFFVSKEDPTDCKIVFFNKIFIRIDPVLLQISQIYCHASANSCPRNTFLSTPNTDPKRIISVKLSFSSLTGNALNLIKRKKKQYDNHSKDFLNRFEDGFGCFLYFYINLTEQFLLLVVDSRLNS